MALLDYLVVVTCLRRAVGDLRLLVVFYARKNGSARQKLPQTN